MSAPPDRPVPRPTSGTLRALAEETRALAARLAAAFRENPERLSVAAWNEAIVRALGNQVAILAALADGAEPGARSPGEGAAHAFDAARGGQLPPRSPPEAAAPGNGNGNGDGLPAGLEHIEDELEIASPTLIEAALAAAPADARDAAAPERDSSGPARNGSEGATATAPGIAGTATSTDAVVAARLVEYAGSAARAFVEAFDNRDKSFERGLDKLNHWLGGGGGTPFQYRGHRAYLNVSGLRPENVTHFEDLLMSRMGFVVRLGRLVVDGLVGDVVVYEKARGARAGEEEAWS